MLRPLNFIKLIGIHGDDRGLVLPYKLAPVQVIIVPIPGDNYDEILEYSDNIQSKLREIGIRCKVDRSDYTPGYKFNDWEMKGVPVRIEIGKKGSGIHCRTYNLVHICMDKYISSYRDPG